MNWARGMTIALGAMVYTSSIWIIATSNIINYSVLINFSAFLIMLFGSMGICFLVLLGFVNNWNNK